MSDALREALRDGLRGWAVAARAAGLTIACFLLLPMLVIVPESFTTSSVLTFPPKLFSTAAYHEIFSDPSWTRAFQSSIEITLIGAAIATATGTFAALALHHRPGRSTVLTTWFLVPLVVPWIVYALGLYVFLSDIGTVGTPLLVAAGQAVLAFPLVFVTVSAGLAAVDPALAIAARSLGSRWPSVVVRVELPLVRSSILGASLFALAYCFDETIVALYVTTPETQTLPVQIFQTAKSSASPTIAAASTVVMGAAVILFAAGSLAITRGRRKWATS